MAGNTAVTAVLALVILLSVLINVCYIVVFVARKRMKTAANLFLLCLATVDLLAVVFWTLFTTMTSSQGEWTLGDTVCRIQVYFFGFCALVNSHILLVLMFERLLKVFKPSKNSEIFFHTTVLMMIGMLLIFDAVLASFPLIGWGTVAYMSDQYQCSIDYIFHDSQLDFSFFWQFAFPVLAISVCYVTIIIRVRLLRKHRTTEGPIILEENYAVPGDAFADRLKKQNMKFQNAGTKRKKPKIKSTDSKDDEDYRSSSGDSSTDSENDGEVVISSSTFTDTTHEQHHEKRWTKGLLSAISEKRKSMKKVYYMSKEDMILVHVYGLVAAAYFSMWFLYFVMSYIYTYSTGPIPSADFILAVACLTHFGSFVKPPFYMLSRKNRLLFMKTMKALPCLNGGQRMRRPAAAGEGQTGDQSLGRNSMGEPTTEL